jgi:hypothetical protein
MVREERRDFQNRDIRKFSGFELVKPSAIDAPLTQEPIGANGIENFPDAADESGIAFQCMSQQRHRIHRQIDIRHRSARVIQDKTERPTRLFIPPPQVVQTIGADGRSS